ncbi:streptophobe family protein [Streptomyces sp. NPDC047453]|uniref:streptophobe family protein n=1 Tax=Streptomyces sp. NPDC047453 TaxID=3154812 RepID=UPI0033F415F6
MSAATDVGTARHGARLPWLDVLLSAIASVSWALIGMAGTAALGLHLLRADAAGSLGPMTAAVVALGAGGSVTPSGDVSAFGLKGAEAHTALQITPLGVSLVGALLLSWFFLRSLRAAGVVIAPAELLARAGAVVALFVAVVGGLAWAGHDVVTIDGGALGLGRLPGGAGSGDVSIPGLGDLGDIGGLLPDRIGRLIDAKAAVGFTVDTAPTLLGGLAWSAGVLLIALLASRRTPLPRGWEAVHRVVRPAVSALVTMLMVVVAAGLAAAAYAAIGDDHPRRIAGAALLGTPNGVWLGITIGLFVPWDGRATGELTGLLPDPLGRLLTAHSDQPVTLSRLADLDGRVWLLGVAAALAMLLAGVLTAVRTPVGAAPGRSPLGFAGRCALRLGIATALALPLLAWPAEVSVDASLSVLGFDAFGAGVELRGHLGTALLLGAVWGAGAGAVGALLASATGAAGSRAAPLARGDRAVAEGGASGAWAAEGAGHDIWTAANEAGRPGRTGGPGPHASGTPYAPATPYRPPNPSTNPYLRLPDELRAPQDARPEESRPRDARPPDGRGLSGGAESAEAGGPGGGRARPGPQDGRGQSGWADSTEPEGPDRPDGPDGGRDRPAGSGDDVYGAPTVVGPVRPLPPPPPRPPKRPPGAQDDGPPPPPGPPRSPKK